MLMRRSITAISISMLMVLAGGVAQAQAADASDEREILVSETSLSEGLDPSLIELESGPDPLFLISDTEDGSGSVAPLFHVGVGRYLYIYLTPRDWNFVSSVGWAAAGGALCTLAGGGPAAGALCGAAGGALGWYLSDKTGPKGNQCAEIKMRAWTSPFGYKVINKPCSEL